jgi:hypothetical protein
MARLLDTPLLSALPKRRRLPLNLRRLQQDARHIHALRTFVGQQSRFAKSWLDANDIIHGGHNADTTSLVSGLTRPDLHGWPRFVICQRKTTGASSVDLGKITHRKLTAAS